MDRVEIFRKIVAMLHRPDGHRVGVVVTADRERRPHAAYMGTVASPQIDRLLTMSAPESRKVMNILENPEVEWLFVDEEAEEVLYARGKARVIADPDEVEKAWAEIPDKSLAYFLSFQDVGIQFLILETAVEEFEYRIPRTNEVFRLSSREIADLRTQ